MEFVTTLIASHAALTTAHLARVTEYLDTQGLALSDAPAWLKQHKAADLYTAYKPNPAQIRAIRALLAESRVDVMVSRTKYRKKKLLISDMDATIIEDETLDELAGHAGKGAECAAITVRAMRGELEFRSALRERVAMLKDLPATILDATLAQVSISPGAELLIAAMKQRGATCVLVSSGFTYFTEAIAGRLGFDHHHGNVLETGSGKILGTVQEPILDKNAKLATVERYMEQLGVSADEVVTIGDGANDLPMLERVSLGIGYHPKPLLVEKLDNLILYGDLTAVFYAQGLVPN